MDDPICVAVVDRLEKLFHVLSCLLFAKRLIFLSNNLIEQRQPVDVLHNYKLVRPLRGRSLEIFEKKISELTDINHFVVVVCFYVVDDIRMVQNVQNLDFLHYLFQRVRHFFFG